MNGAKHDIGKRLPYSESQQYLDDLINKATEQAIMHHAIRGQTSRKSMIIASAAAIVLLLIGIGVAVIQHESTQQTVVLQSEGPLDEFLNTLTDEEAAQLQYYEIEEIPEY